MRAQLSDPLRPMISYYRDLQGISGWALIGLPWCRDDNGMHHEPHDNVLRCKMFLKLYSVWTIIGVSCKKSVTVSFNMCNPQSTYHKFCANDNLIRPIESYQQTRWVKHQSCQPQVGLIGNRLIYGRGRYVQS